MALKPVFSYSPSLIGKGLGVRFFVNIGTFQTSSKAGCGFNFWKYFYKDCIKQRKQPYLISEG
jgi:hypothetical protein